MATYSKNTFYKLCACQFICVCVLKSSHSPRLRLEEDVVEDNMVARIKLCYGHFEVWSL